MSNKESIERQIRGKNDRLFFSRVHSVPHEDYISRLEAISFYKMDKVCDAGCGYGQWSFPLAEINESVHAIDYSEERISICNKLLDESSSNINLNFSIEDIQETNYPDQYFDGIFSYSVIFGTDYRKTLREFYRLLKPGGKLYFTANDVGWYAHNIVSKPNATSDFNPRHMAIQAISDTCHYFKTGTHVEGSTIIMPIDLVIREVENLGLKVILYGPDGAINMSETANPKPFYKEEYYGFLGPYEILLVKGT